MARIPDVNLSRSPTVPPLSSPPHRPRSPALVALLAALAGAAAAVAVSGALPAAAAAQLISLRTVPVAAGDQFVLFPSRNLGMGGVSLAVRDPWLDPFVNPAEGARDGAAPLFGAPVFYGVSGGNGGARTLPLGGRLRSGAWFGALALAYQQLESADRQDVVVLDALVRRGALPDRLVGPWGWGGQPLRDRLADNLYGYAALGRRLGDGRTALGASVLLADLQGVDGVDLLYALSRRVEQRGGLADFRLGLVRDLPGDRSLEALLLHHRFGMRHDVSYLDWAPDPAGGGVVPVIREERNWDRTRTWGVSLGYEQPLGGAGWRIGGLLVANWKTHPRIPNYEIMAIPRDPGRSWAYDFGVGIARALDGATVGLDLIYEPAWTETWAEAAAPVPTPRGDTIPAGGRTVENDFRFSNLHLRAGVSHELGPADLQLGLQLRSVRYWLDQVDRVRGTSREQAESWAEWTPTWGLALRLPALELRYAGRLTLGTGRPGALWTPDRARAIAESRLMGADFLPAPGGPLTLQEARVLTHQVAVSLPLGGRLRSGAWFGA
ncbi:MAG TPA: hypothetical protein VNI61_02245, partial [Gemmatimonadales bacterium]|nr:hypothetical protein [Gemmatimonadales bacterium]